MAERRQESREGMEGREEQAASPERVSRRGETPRQQMLLCEVASLRSTSPPGQAHHPPGLHGGGQDPDRDGGHPCLRQASRGEIPVSELCRRERLHTTVYYRWLKGLS
jgi:hypothetical protein